MTTSIKTQYPYRSGRTLVKSATLVAQQGSWKWQRRLRRVEYVPTKLKDGRIVWANPIETSNKISGGNLRDPNHWQGEQSPIYRELSSSELATVGMLCLSVYPFQRL